MWRVHPVKPGVWEFCRQVTCTLSPHFGYRPFRSINPIDDQVVNFTVEVKP